MFIPSSRLQSVEESKSVKLSALVAKLKAQGKNIIALNVGEPTFNPNDAIISATQSALAEFKTRYDLVPGTNELREEIALKENRKKENILISNGSKQILYNLFQVILNPDDEVIIPTPYWTSFPESIRLASGRPVFSSGEDLDLDLSDIESKITPKTKAIIINSPNNPSGHIYSTESLTQLALIAQKHDLLIISDEAYDEIVYDGLSPFSVASISQDAYERTIQVKSFSKTYCMTGFRLGYLLAKPEIVQAVNKLQSHLSGNNCTFAQYGALAALKMDQSCVTEMVKKMEGKRNLAYSLFNELFPHKKPQGAFYLFPQIKNDDIDFCERILKEAHVALLPGSAFGAPGYFRLSYTASDEDLNTAYQRIKAIL